MAAQLVSFGLDGVGYLLHMGHDERLLVVAVAQRLAEVRAQEREDLAVRIINDLSKALRK